MFKYSVVLLPFALASCGVVADIQASLELADRQAQYEDLEQLIASPEDAELEGLGDEVFNERSQEAAQAQAEAEAAAEASGADPETASGTVVYNYEGLAGVLVPQDGPNDIYIVAEAEVAADFQSNSLSAEFNDWIFYEEGDTLAESDVDGNITFSNGTIGEGGDPSIVTGDVEGTLTVAGVDYSVDGAVEGDFATTMSGGQMVEGVGAVTVDDAAILVDGEAAAGSQFGFGAEFVDKETVITTN